MTLKEKYNEFLNKRFPNSHLTIIDIMPERLDGKVMVKCRCDCGNEKIVRLRHLQEGLTKSCGMCDFKRNATRDACMLDLKGKQFNSLLALEPTNKRKYSFVIWKCKCLRCGRIVEVSSRELVSGIKKTCGMCGYKDEVVRNACKKYFTDDEKVLGMSIFPNMVRRCYNKLDRAYPYYGAKGVTICDEWLKDRTLFVKWALSHGYKRGLSIDRIDVNGPYSPENCRWVDMITQENNRSDNHRITVDNITKTCSEWARELDISPDRLYCHENDDIVANMIRMLIKARNELGPRYEEFKKGRILSSTNYLRFFGGGISKSHHKRYNRVITVADISKSCARWDAYFLLPAGYMQNYYKEHGEEATAKFIADRLNVKKVHI